MLYEEQNTSGTDSLNTTHIDKLQGGVGGGAGLMQGRGKGWVDARERGGAGLMQGRGEGLG